MSGTNLEGKVRAEIQRAPRQVQDIIGYVLEIEGQNLHLKQPHTKDEIVKFIKKVVK